MRVHEGLKSVRELGWMLKTEWCISRFIYPDNYSPSLRSSAKPFASIGEMSRSQGEPQRHDQSYRGHLREGKTYKRPSANHPTQVDSD